MKKIKTTRYDVAEHLRTREEMAAVYARERWARRMLCLSFGIEMIPNILIILANLEAAWLFYVLRGSITSYGAHSETNLTRLAGFQIIISVGMAFVCLYLSRRQSKY